MLNIVCSVFSHWDIWRMDSDFHDFAEFTSSNNIVLPPPPSQTSLCIWACEWYSNNRWAFVCVSDDVNNNTWFVSEVWRQSRDKVETFWMTDFVNLTHFVSNNNKSDLCKHLLWSLQIWDIVNRLSLAGMVEPVWTAQMDSIPACASRNSQEQTVRRVSVNHQTSISETSKVSVSIYLKATVSRQNSATHSTRWLLTMRILVVIGIPDSADYEYTRRQWQAFALYIEHTGITEKATNTLLAVAKDIHR